MTAVRTPKLSSESLLAEAKRLQGLDDSGQFFVKDGDTAAAFGTAAKVMEAEYTTSINIHAPMEPMNATAEFKGDILHIYSGNQFATRSGAIAAGAAGIDPKFVVMHQMWLGGGFGRRLDADMMVPAVQAAKAVGKPVKVIYTRENDMTMDFSRPLTYQKVKAGLDADGKLIALNHDVVSAWPTAALGNPRFPVALGRQERPARRLHREWRGLLLLRAQPLCPRDQERDGAQRHPVRPVPLGGAGMDVLGGRKHDRRDSPMRPARIRRSTASRCSTARARTTAARNACATRCSPRWAWPATARKQAAEGRRHGRGLRLVAGTGDRELDRLRRPCRGGAIGRGQGQEADGGHRRRHAGASRQHPRPGRGCGAVGPFARACTRRRR